MLIYQRVYQVDSSCMLRSYGHGICIPSSGRRAQADDRYVYGNPQNDQMIEFTTMFFVAC